MLDFLQWEPLESRRSKLQLTLLYKIVHNLVDVEAEFYLAPATTRFDTFHEVQTDFYDDLAFSYVPYLCGTLFQLL